MLPRTATIARRRFATTLSAGGTGDPTAHCRALVQKHDYESFLCSHFYPRDRQPGFFALNAFFVELAMLQDTVSSSAIGRMRLQFWRDAIKGIAEGRPPRHPIALALHEASTSANLQRYHLKRIVDAREDELANPSHRTLASLTAHAESTTASLLYLLLALGGFPDAAGTLTHAASHVGAAKSFAVRLRALPFHASRGHLVVPADVAARHNVRQEDVFRGVRRGGPVQGLADAVYEVAVAANDHLRAARAMFAEQGGKVPRAAMPVFLSGVPVAAYLARLENAGFDALHPSLQVRDWRLPWWIWRGYYRNMF